VLLDLVEDAYYELSFLYRPISYQIVSVLSGGASVGVCPNEFSIQHVAVFITQEVFIAYGDTKTWELLMNAVSNCVSVPFEPGPSPVAFRNCCRSSPA